MTKYTRTLIDNVILGTEGSCRVFVLFKNCCYNDNKLIPVFSISLYTLKNFPSKIEHFIEWALNKFYDFFTLPLEE